MSASTIIRRSVFARAGVAATRAPAVQSRGYATKRSTGQQHEEPANAAEKVGKALKVSAGCLAPLYRRAPSLARGHAQL